MDSYPSSIIYKRVTLDILLNPSASEFPYLSMGARPPQACLNNQVSNTPSNMPFIF